MDLINSEVVTSIPQANIAWILILIIGVVFAIISTVLVYHWQRYGVHKNTVRVVTTTYFVVSFILLYSLVHITIGMSLN